MNLNLFAKHKTGTSQKTNTKYDFYSYTTRMTRKDGEVITAQVKFSNVDAPNGAECPITIIVNKKDMNLVVEHNEVRNDDGDIIEVKTYYTLWVKAYTAQEYIDHSLDDFLD